MAMLKVYYGGIGPLYATRWEDEGNVQDLARYTPPHADGQYATAMGRKARTCRGEFVFFPTVLKDKDAYPLRLTQIRKFVAENLEPQALVHPTDGQIYGFFSQFQVKWSAEERNGARVEFTFEEANTTNTVLSANDLLEISKEPMNLARQAASVADVAFKVLGLPVPSQFGTFVNATDEFQEVLDTVEVTTLQLTSAVNSIRSELSRVLLVPELEDPRNYDAFAAIRSMSVNLAKAAEYASIRAINILELDPLQEEFTAMDLALRIYGDVDRCVDIARYNPVPNFFYPVGSIIRFADR